MNKPFTISTVNWQAEKAALMMIRECVFIQEQQVPIVDEWDNHDETAIHFLVKNEESNAIGCARLLTELHGHKTVFHIGRVAILKKYRHQCIGRYLMETIIHYCHTCNNENAIYLHAQVTRQLFYEHLQFVAQGPVFMDAGIEHIEMWHKGASHL